MKRKMKNSIKKKRFFIGLNSIRVRLLGSYVILLAFVILVGVMSYINASNAIIHNYETSTKQTLDMLSGHLEYGFSSAQSIAVECLVDPTMNEYLSGGYEKDKNKHYAYYVGKKENLSQKRMQILLLAESTFFPMLYIRFLPIKNPH